MKKYLLTLLIPLAIVIGVAGVNAAGGDANDPFLSLSYLTGLFRQQVETEVDSRVATADEALTQTLQDELEVMEAAVRAAAAGAFAPSPVECTLKQGDRLLGSTGLVVVPLAGEMTVSLSSGVLLDVTLGVEVSSGTVLTTNHRYIVAEDSNAVIEVTSPAAVLSYEGRYSMVLSQQSPDCYAIACGLRELGLFQGTGSAIGEGFELYRQPTRIESIVMFIRLIGEEEQALSCQTKYPFTDVPAWASGYVSWAYQQGYSNGISADKFGSQNLISAAEYMELFLRATGYSAVGEDDYRTSLTRAAEHTIITAAEESALSADSFLRAHVVYLSYYGLDVVCNGTCRTVAENLQSAGVFTASDYQTAKGLVKSHRIS